MKVHSILWSLILAVTFSSCSVEIDQSGNPISSPQVVTVPTALLSPEGTLQPNTVTTSQIPVTWDSLNLTGRLVYTNAIVVEDVFRLQIQILNLVTGEVTTIFEAPKYSWIYYVTVSPDNKYLLMSYNLRPVQTSL